MHKMRGRSTAEFRTRFDCGRCDYSAIALIIATGLGRGHTRSRALARATEDSRRIAEASRGHVRCPCCGWRDPTRAWERRMQIGAATAIAIVPAVAMAMLVLPAPGVLVPALIAAAYYSQVSRPWRGLRRRVRFVDAPEATLIVSGR